MQLGMVGLGRMGANMVRRLARDGHRCVVFDRSPEAVKAVVDGSVTGTTTLERLVAELSRPRAVWVTLPAGEITEDTITKLGELLDAGDAIIDGGNAFYRDDVRRAEHLRSKGIHHIDCGTSGGVWGFDRGYCLMIGGEREAVARLDPIFKTLAPGRGDVSATPGRNGRDPRVECGYMHCGPSGAGRFVKMIHNGIEYGIMQAYAEGFNVLHGAASETLPEDQRYQFDLRDIAELWRRGSVIGSWLLDLTAMALAQDPKLSGYSGFVEDSGEGRWTVEAAIEEAVPAVVLTAALYARFRSREKASVADKLLSAMRHAFGGHVEPKADQ
jgi:6-phosphogluconate dehydrogenase